MGTPNKVTPEVQAELLRLWTEGSSQKQIAERLGLNRSSVMNHLRSLLGVETPDWWKGSGRVALIRPVQPKDLPPPVIYPENPPRLTTPCELSPGEAARFWVKVAAPNENGCRLWLASVQTNGAGQFGTIESPSETAYRVAWRLTYGPIPEGRQVNHRCDVRLCCEPTHFWLGTQAENLADMAAKGRARQGQHQGAKGEDNVTAKLTWEKVRALRQTRAQQGLTVKQLAKRFGIGASQVSRILTNKCWLE